MSTGLVVLVPASPRDHIVDTVDSVSTWLPDAQVVVLNDSDHAVPGLLRPNVCILPALPFPRNNLGGLWAKEAFALRWILENCPNSKYIFRLDADALVLRSGLEHEAHRIFSADKKIGIVGGARLTGTGSPRDFGPAAQALSSHTSLRGLRKPRVRKTVNQLVSTALTHGYELGEHAIACASLLRVEMIQDWFRLGWLDATRLSGAALADDFLMSLMCYASGYRIYEAGGPSGLFCLSWRGLPMSPAAVMASGAFATHSVRSWSGLSEREIRQEFAAARVVSGAAERPEDQL